MQKMLKEQKGQEQKGQFFNLEQKCGAKGAKGSVL